MRKTHLLLVSSAVLISLGCNLMANVAPTPIVAIATVEPSIDVKATATTAVPPSTATPIPTEEASAPAEEPEVDVATFLAGLPDWSTYSPIEPNFGPAPAGQQVSFEDPVTVSAPSRDESGYILRNENGEPQAYEDLIHNCTTTPYVLVHTPESLVMYDPDGSVLWPGSIIQGKSYVDLESPIQSLPIAQRAPITISIPEFLSEEAIRTVEEPNLNSVSGAIHSMLAGAADAGWSTPDKIELEVHLYHSDAQFAANFGASGQALGFSHSAEGDLSREVQETTIAVHLYQPMFSVLVTPPQTPGDIFSEPFGPELLQEQVDLGRIGADNPTVYVSEVIYGRMMMFTLTAAASEKEIRDTVTTAFESIGGDGTELSAGERYLLDNAKIAVASYGNETSAPAAMIRSGEWSQFFTPEVTLTSARPLSYVFSSLDGSPAKVSESTSVDVRECQAVARSGETFQFLPEQVYGGPQIGVPYDTAVGDVNGDGRSDLVFNHKSAENNQFAVGLANSDGSFAFSVVQEHTESAPEGWGSFKTLLADVSGDGRADLIWNETGRSNRIAVGLSNGDGTFTLGPLQTHPAQGWAPYATFSGDVNGDQLADLIWNVTIEPNRSYAGLSNGDGTFELIMPGQDHPASGWEYYESFVGDFNGDGLTDLLWNEAGAINRTYIGLANGDGTFDLNGPARDKDVCCGYVTLLGDINGDRRTDLVWSGVPTTHNITYSGLGQADGSFDFLRPFQTHPEFLEWQYYEPLMADLNGDGKNDLIWNDSHTTTDTLFVALATGDYQFAFDFSRLSQQHPEEENWSGSLLLAADVNGDGRDDLIWVFPETVPRVFVALSVG